ncbi:MAG: hypothetical protein LBU87_05305, partial [Lactobacillales bacterium]|nr:hypothetical protein [Lactobacillales bacterium]
MCISSSFSKYFRIKYPAFLCGLLSTAFFFFSVPVRGQQTITYPGSTLRNPRDLSANFTDAPNSLFPDSPSNNIVTSEANISGSLFGGMGDTGIDSSSNNVSVTGGRIAENVTGCWSLNSRADNNTVSIVNGRVDGITYGAWVNGGSAGASGNQVTAGTGTTVHNIYGAYSNGTGDITENTVNISNATVVGSGAFVAGGYVGVGNHGADVSNNSVTIGEGSTISGSNVQIYGGKGTTSANVYSNNVTIEGGLVNGSIYGGMNAGGTGMVEANSVDIKGGIIGANIYGGQSNNGDDVHWNGANIYGGNVVGNIYGGHAKTGDASENYINMAGGTVAGDVYGGYGEDIVQKSNVNIWKGIINGNVYGGWSTTLTADWNAVGMLDGTVDGNVYAGYAETNNASYNYFSLQGGTITGTVYTGYAENGNVTAGSADIFGGTVKGDFYAGYTDSGTVSSNTLSMFGGTIEGTAYGNNLVSWQTDDNSFSAVSGFSSVGGISNFQSSTINAGATLNVTKNTVHAATFQDLSNNGLMTFYNGFTTSEVAHIQGDYTGAGKIGLDVLFGQNSADTLLFDKAPASSVVLTFNALPGSLQAQDMPLTKIAEVSSGARDGLFTTAGNDHYGIYTYDILRISDEYFLGLTAANAGETGKIYSEAGAAGLAQLWDSDNLLRNSLDSAVDATAGRGFGISANLGYSSQRIDTGSHVDLEGMSGLVTVAY